MTLLQRLLVEAHTPGTAKLTITMVKGVLHQAWRLGFIDSDRYMRTTATGKIRGSRLSAGRALSKEEVTTLREYIASLPSPYSVMVWAIFLCGFGAGLRREEIAALTVGSLTEDGHLRLVGKGNKERLQPLPPALLVALRHWLRERARLELRCAGLFVQLTSSGQLRDAGLTGWSCWRLMTSISRQAGIARFAPHDLRRTFFARMIDKTDLVTVSKLMGHSDVKTTAGYDRRGESVKEAAVLKFEELADPEVGNIAGGAALEKLKRTAEAPIAQPAQRTQSMKHDLAWVREQARAMAARGFSSAQVATALAKAGVVKKGGAELAAADVERLL
jgi:integrase